MHLRIKKIAHKKAYGYLPIRFVQIKNDRKIRIAYIVKNGWSNEKCTLEFRHTNPAP